jgi:phage protein D
LISAKVARATITIIREKLNKTNRISIAVHEDSSEASSPLKPVNGARLKQELTEFTFAESSQYGKARTRTQLSRNRSGKIIFWVFVI